MRQILAVEDSEDAQALIVAALGDDYAVRLAPTLADARQQLESAVPDLVLLDVELPDGSGFQLCSELQAASGTREVPVVFLTSHTATGEKVLAFSLGADDYLDKPFDPLELRARVESRLRKRDLRSERAIAYGPFRIDLGRFKALLVTPEGSEELDATPHEIKLLCELVSRRGEIVKREDLARFHRSG